MRVPLVVAAAVTAALPVGDPVPDGVFVTAEDAVADDAPVCDPVALVVYAGLPVTDNAALPLGVSAAVAVDAGVDVALAAGVPDPVKLAVASPLPLIAGDCVADADAGGVPAGDPLAPALLLPVALPVTVAPAVCDAGERDADNVATPVPVPLGDPLLDQLPVTLPTGLAVALLLAVPVTDPLHDPVRDRVLPAVAVTGVPVTLGVFRGVPNAPNPSGLSLPDDQPGGDSGGHTGNKCRRRCWVPPEPTSHETAGGAALQRMPDAKDTSTNWWVALEMRKHCWVEGE